MAVDDAARGAVKLVKWLAGQADDIVPTAEDIQRFGPNAARVRSLLDFIPTMSDEAARVSDKARNFTIANPLGKSWSDAVDAAWEAASKSGRSGMSDTAFFAVEDFLFPQRKLSLGTEGAAKGVAIVEPVVDLIDPQTYRTLTNPLAAGRAVDVLRTRPRLQNTRFLDIARQAAERGAVTGPRDIVAVSRIAQKGEDVQEIALALMGDGMSAEQAMRTARMLAQ